MPHESLSAGPALAPGRLPPGLRVYAVGDIHGCADRLAELHRGIAADAGRQPPADHTVLLYLGDHVDRGPDSAGVLDLLMGRPPLEAEVVTLAGNHESMMLAACDPMAHRGALPFWLENGGDATLASYGTDAAEPAWWEAIPEEHLAFLRGCRLSWAAGDYLFVHAGIRPEVPLERQDPFDLLWIREPFLSWPGPLPAVVVHGHTPTPAPALRDYRIGIDTGCCFGGDLTCLVLEADMMRFLVA